MISEERMREIAEDWGGRTPEEKACILQKANQLRSEANSWGPYYSTNCKIFHQYSIDIAKQFIVDELGLNIDEPIYGGAWAAIEIAILEDLRSPELMAWDRASKYLLQALEDPVIKANPEAVEVLKVVWSKTSFRSNKETTADEFVPPVEKLIKWAASRRAAEVASKKNADARAWVLTEWQGRPDLGQSKASFARQYVPLVKQRFGVLVTEDTIKRDWLPKSAK